jgi:DNA-binding transcriptional LysR family regulator
MARPALEAGELELLLPEWRLPEGQMHLVYPHRRGLLPAVWGLIDHLVGELPRLARDTGLSSSGEASG